MAHGQTGPKFTETEREAVKEYVAQLDRRGHTQMEIARLVSDKYTQISQVTIHVMLKQIREEYRSRRFTAIDANREEKRAQYAEIRKCAWEQYEKCVEGEVTVTEEHEITKVPKTVTPPHLKSRWFVKGEAPKTIEELEMRLKRTIIRSSTKRAEAAVFLNIIMRCLDAEREMDGLVSKMVTLVPQQPTLDWDALLRRPAGTVTDANVQPTAIADKPADPVEDKIAELEALPQVNPDKPPSTNGNGQAH